MEAFLSERLRTKLNGCLHGTGQPHLVCEVGIDDERLRIINLQGLINTYGWFGYMVCPGSLGANAACQSCIAGSKTERTVKNNMSQTQLAKMPEEPSVLSFITVKTQV